MRTRKWRFFQALVRRQHTILLHATAKSRRRTLKQTFALSTIACLFLGQHAFSEETPVVSGTPPPSTTLPEVVVTGEQGYYKPQGVASPKYTRELLDTAQTATVVPKEVMEDRGVTTLRDTLRNVPGISLNAGEAGNQGDNLTVRGFSARSDIFRDGMRDFGSYYRDPFNDQQVEVLKGPASVNFGRGSTGGVVNQVSKTPQLEAYNEATLAVGTDKTKRATADLNAPLTGISDKAAVRVNVMAHDSEVTDRDIAEFKRFGFAPTVASGIGTPSRLSVSHFFQSESDIPDYGLPFLLGRPAPVDWENSYGYKDHNFIHTSANVSTLKGEQDLGENVTLRDQFRYARYKRDVQITEPRIPTSVTAATPLANIQVTRGQIVADSVETYLSNQTDAKIKLNTGPVEHTVVTGVEIGQETSDPERQTVNGVPSTSLLNPDNNQPYTATSAAVTSRVHTIAKSLGLYLIDTLKFGPHWELTGGLRWDEFDAHYQQTVAPIASFERVDKMISKRGSLVYKPVPAGSLYLSYGNSFNPSAEQLALAANNANLDPEETKAYEFGAKWELFNRTLALTGAIFRDDKTNARTVDPTNPLLNVLSGKQRVEGFELGATGRLTEKWQVFTGYAFMESQVRESNNALEKGSPVANAPKHSGNLWTTYDFPRKIQMGVGANAVSSRATTATRDAATGILKEVPGYMTFDAMIKAPASDKITLQLNLYNLLDQEYFDTLHPSHIIPGAGRTLLLTTRIDF